MTQLLAIRRNAFTILELLVAIAVIGLMAAAVTPYGISRVCDARHNALVQGISTELFTARLFALNNNRNLRINLRNTTDGIAVARYYNLSSSSACPSSSPSSNSVVLANRVFERVAPVGFSNSHFCINGAGRLDGHSYNAVALIIHNCASREYALRVNFVGKAGFFLFEERLPLPPGSAWRRI